MANYQTLSDEGVEYRYDDEGQIEVKIYTRRNSAGEVIDEKLRLQAQPPKTSPETTSDSAVKTAPQTPSKEQATLSGIRSALNRFIPRR